MQSLTPLSRSNDETAAIKARMVARLRRVEGQVRGVQKMVEDDRDCQAVLQQLNAAAAALQNATDLFVRAYAKECLLRMDFGAAEGSAAHDGALGEEKLRDRAAVIDRLLDLMVKARS